LREERDKGLEARVKGKNQATNGSGFDKHALAFSTDAEEK
jgi:hypothetical protein